MQMRTRIRAGALAATLIAVAAAPAVAQDFKGHTLVVGTWGGDIERLLRAHVAGPLEARPGPR